MSFNFDISWVVPFSPSPDGVTCEESVAIVFVPCVERPCWIFWCKNGGYAGRVGNVEWNFCPFFDEFLVLPFSDAALSCEEFAELGWCFIGPFSGGIDVKSSYEASPERFIRLVLAFVDGAS